MGSIMSIIGLILADERVFYKFKFITNFNKEVRKRRIKQAPLDKPVYNEPYVPTIRTYYRSVMGTYTSIIGAFWWAFGDLVLLGSK